MYVLPCCLLSECRYIFIYCIYIFFILVAGILEVYIYLFFCKRAFNFLAFLFCRLGLARSSLRLLAAARTAAQRFLQANSKHEYVYIV